MCLCEVVGGVRVCVYFKSRVSSVCVKLYELRAIVRIHH